MDKLKSFYLDTAMKEAVKEYLDSYFKSVAVQRVMTRKDVSGIADAKEIIEKAFSHLATKYSQKSDRQQNESI
jgi:hypothetical protein